MEQHQSTVIADGSGSWSNIAVDGSGSRSRGSGIDDCPNPRRSAAAPAAGLPDDAIVEILSRVPARSVQRFKCVSRAWRGLIADPLHSKRLPQTLEGFFCSDVEFRHGVGGAAAPWNIRRHVHRSFVSLPGRVSEAHGSLGYIVCNPATEQWVAVPSAGRFYPVSQAQAPTYLIADPAMSPHFHLVHIWQNDFLGEIDVCTYSSESGAWCHRSSDRRQWQEGGGWEEWVNGGAMIKSMLGSVFVKGVQRFVIFDARKKGDVISGVDREGKTCRNISLPDECGGSALLIGQSQGLLHYVSEHVDHEGNRSQWSGLSVWVLEDYDTDEWVLKHRVSFLKLFGKTDCSAGFEYNVLAIHPDRNMIFLLQNINRKLISYDMDSKELQALHTLRSSDGFFTPYVPCFMESSVLLANKD
ncbi:hypothetical protein PVAP13_2NG068800 [Panicum virgatum]|uniref:F-box domain-containing protein n=1 Tax=Panicum virgatum TaxID=38727 RepID=A0A8T0VF62_PANVG|nr:hypothetical protein PVAP13_2NG068800 [Panicum virgatum]